MSYPKSPVLKGPKRHHFLPRMYLKGFCQDELLAVFDRETGLIKRQTIENTGLQGHLYTYEDESGRRRFDIEALLSKIESDLSHAICKFEEGGKFTAAEIGHLISFVAFAELRTPEALDQTAKVYASFVRTTAKVVASSKQRTASTLASMYRDRGEIRSNEEIQAEAERIVDFVKKDDYSIKIDKQMALMQNMKLWVKVAHALEKKNIRFVRTTDDNSHYLTCDSPVILESRTNEIVGFESPSSMIFFPLTSKCLVIFSGSDRFTGSGTANAKQVDNVNELIALNTDRYLIGPDEAALARITDRLGIARTQRGPKYETSHLPTRDGAISVVRRVLPHRTKPKDVGS